MSSVINELFTEKFRPKNLDQLIAPSRIKNELNKGLVQNLLLHGSAGTGKTSAAFILSNPYNTLYINAREDANVEFVRNKVSRFCASISLEGGKEKMKCVFIDEFDGASAGFFDAIKVPMEKYVKNARFIACTNFIQLIPDAVQSRFNCISFDSINNEEEIYVFEEYKKRIKLILTAAKITYTEEILDKFVHNDFPDMRKLMNKIQSFYLRGIKELNAKNFNINYDYVDLFKLCLNGPEKPYENYKLIISEYSSKIDDAMMAIGSDFIEYLKNNVPNKMDKIPLVIITTAEHQAQRTMVIDPIITLLSLIFKLQTILK
jgi:DNA polymerase III delta prime subunit